MDETDEELQEDTVDAEAILAKIRQLRYTHSGALDFPGMKWEALLSWLQENGCDVDSLPPGYRGE